MDTSSKHERLANRIVNILLELFEKGSVSRHELARRFKVSERTVYRDLNRLGGFITCSSSGVYRIALNKDENNSLPSLTTFIERTGLSKLLPLQDNRSMVDVLRAIEYKRIDILSLPAESLATDHHKTQFARLELAIRDNRVCQIQYKNKYRAVRPYRLMNVKGIWYLAATDNVLAIKAYQISNIQWVDIKKETFTPDNDIQDYLDNEDDIWFSLNKVEVVVEVLPEVAGYFERRNIFPQQKILQKSNMGKLIISTKIAHNIQLFSILRFWLPNIKIISPPELSEKFKSELASFIAFMQ
ncbi:helix-turn-helix transcriptional regulator [Pantoea piersonii]|uniref:helix-turn-helix transcriptional regulator n=1 Tax=Pantoea piersonii TaxID=2364647 RepID=UPI0028B1F84E|nr:WYL domain-containing protein [Pantoea piersonii]